MKEQLTPVEKLSMAPFWSTFCGTSNGAWQGVQAAFSPVTGKAQELLPHPGVSFSSACPWQGTPTQRRLCMHVVSTTPYKHARMI